MTGFLIGTYPAAIEIAIARTKDDGALFAHRPYRNRNLCIVTADRSDPNIVGVIVNGRETWPPPFFSDEELIDSILQDHPA